MTIGTMDGANVEMVEEMGIENAFIFGMTVPEVAALERAGHKGQYFYERNEELKQVIDQIRGGYFSPGNPNEFGGLADILMYHDRFHTCADYEAYIKCQEKVNETYLVSSGRGK